MEINDIVTLFNYNCWANKQIMKSVSSLNDDQFTATIQSGHGSVRGIIVHILSADLIWRRRCQEGISPDRFFDENLFPNPESVSERLIKEQAEMMRYLGSLKNGDLQSTIEYKTTKGTVYKNILWHIILHMFNHGTHHRSELSEVLTQYNNSPGDIDFILYLRNSPYKS